MRFRPLHVVRLLVIVCLALLVVTVIVCRKPVLETWYIHRLEDDDWNVRRGAAMELGRLESSRAVPALLALWNRESDTLPNAPGIRPTGLTSYYRRGPREFGQLRGERLGRAKIILTVLERIGARSLPALVAALEDDGRADLRHAAAIALEQLGQVASPALLPLTIALGDEEELVRLTALNALVALGPPGIPAVLSALKSDDDFLVLRVLDRLVRRSTPSPDVLRAVEELLRSRGPETSRVVFYSIRHLYGRRRQPPDTYFRYLRSAMAGGSGQVPCLAAGELGQRLGAAVIPELVDFAKAREKQAYDAWRPFFALCPDPIFAENSSQRTRRAPRARSSAEVSRLRTDRNFTSELIASPVRERGSRAAQRRTGLAAVGESNGSTVGTVGGVVTPRAPSDWTPETLGARQPAVIDALRRALDARLTNARGAALHALGKFVSESPEALQVLHASLSDPYLRRAAIDVLIETDPAVFHNVAARLERAFHEREVGDFSLAARIVPRLEPERGWMIPVLIHALPIKDFSHAAKRALEEISATPAWQVAAVPDLIDALDSPRGRGAVTYLRAMGPAAIDSLTAAIGDPRRSVRLGVLQVLGELGSESAPAVPAMIKSLDHPDRFTRERTVRALGLIGFAARSAVPRLERTKRNDTNHRVRFAAADALHDIAAARVGEN